MKSKVSRDKSKEEIKEEVGNVYIVFLVLWNLIVLVLNRLEIKSKKIKYVFIIII